MKIIYLILLFKIILVSKVSAETGCIKGDCRGVLVENLQLEHTYMIMEIPMLESGCMAERYGKGVYTYNNGDTYNGEFVHNRKDGNGVYTSADGTKTEGIWSDNEISVVCISGNCKNGKGVIKKNTFIK